MVAVAIVALALAGCAQTPSAQAPAPAETGETASPSATPSPTPTIPVGPVEMTDEQAAEMYLNFVCQSNDIGSRLAALFDEDEREFINGGNPSVKKINKLAAEGLRIARAAVEVVDDDYFVWPDKVAAEVQVVRDAYIADASTWSNLANAKTFEDAYYTQWPNTDEAAKASQEIRYQLDIDPDTSSSCKGYENGTDGAHKAMTERREYLASFGNED